MSIYAAMQSSILFYSIVLSASPNIVWQYHRFIRMKIEQVLLQNRQHTHANILPVDVPTFGQWVTIFYRLNFENPPTALTPR